jgi:hypothetical protein
VNVHKIICALSVEWWVFNDEDLNNTNETKLTCDLLRIEIKKWTSFFSTFDGDHNRMCVMTMTMFLSLHALMFLLSFNVSSRRLSWWSVLRFVRRGLSGNEIKRFTLWVMNWGSFCWLLFFWFFKVWFERSLIWNLNTKI